MLQRFGEYNPNPHFPHLPLILLFGILISVFVSLLVQQPTTQIIATIRYDNLTMPASSIRSIGVVTCSTRPTRVNPYITQHISELLADIIREVPGLRGAALETIDLEAQGLPLYDEPAVPAGLPADDPTPHYRAAHTRRWSAVVRAHDAFVFVTPQYNWSVPASLKNALDYLYHEWGGKPAAVVTYGSRGGGRAAAHLQQILTGLKMVVAGTAVPLSISMSDIDECLAEGALTRSVVERWAGEGGVTEALRSAAGEMGGQ
ncbi:hypothetical protein V2A60_002006 [Cordyceps javanica]|uniref:NADPH-dependent FMN reductase n=1 Tax=Cordyceps javanica TaxID=43265 RepID=A0A545VGW5_9HYPO|nr:NADPH-dependent FMN reductase [Cordyceps javanica]TQW12144.1 NADPH-dependent FMN reductase [Cordyceps javanica]